MNQIMYQNIYIYLFDNPYHNKLYPTNELQYLWSNQKCMISNYLLESWKSFAYHGYPDIKWKPYNENCEILYIDSNKNKIELKVDNKILTIDKLWYTIQPLYFSSLFKNEYKPNEMIFSIISLFKSLIYH